MAGGKHILGKAKRHIFGTAKVGEKGQIVIPKAARQMKYSGRWRDRHGTDDTI